MAERKIRHSLVRYRVTVDGQERPELAFRNQIVDIPYGQVERLDRLGATVPVEEDLPRPGRMLALPETATEAEILSWVMGATKDEVADLVKQRPVMAERIESAAEAVAKRFEEQNAHLGGLRKIADEAKADEPSTPETGTSEPSNPAPAEGTNPEGDGGNPPADGDGDEDLIGPAEFTAEQADALVAEGAKPAQEFISNNPRHAGAVLEAEGRLAEKEKREARVSIVRAAQAAAGFTQ